MEQKAADSIPVDLIRTVAIILVIVIHSASEPVQIADIMSPEGVAQWWTVNIYNSLAKPAVPLFVMLTGALLLRPERVTEPLRVFYKKRIDRIALPFIFWTIAYFAWRAFVNGETLTFSSILQGVLTGSYNHLWYIYLLVGLYLITPMARVLVTYINRKAFTLLLILWFVGTGILPVLRLFGAYEVNGNVFLVTGWVGYFILGAYVLKTHARRAVLYSVLILELAWTIVGTYLVVGNIGERFGSFFYDSTSFGMIGASAALFLLLIAVPQRSIESRYPLISRILGIISQNTLGIYLFHVMILEALQKGFFGLKISLTTINPIIEVPLLTATTLLISLGVVHFAKKIPYVKRVFG